MRVTPKILYNFRRQISTANFDFSQDGNFDLLRIVHSPSKPKNLEMRMRLFAFIIFVSVMLLATCSAPGTTPAPVETEMPALPVSSPQPTNTRPSPALAPGASVDPA